MKNTPISQYEFETRLRDILKHGDETAMAKAAGTGESIINQMCNPHDERISWLYRAAQMICGLDNNSTERGDEVVNLIQCTRATNSPELAESCLPTEAGKFAKEHGEFMQAHLEGKEWHIQLKELVDVEQQIKRMRQSIIAKINDEMHPTEIQERYFQPAANGDGRKQAVRR